MISLCEATQNDQIRLLYKFENDQTIFGCVGSCGYAPASVKSYTIVGSSSKIGYDFRKKVFRKLKLSNIIFNNKLVHKLLFLI